MAVYTPKFTFLDSNNNVITSAHMGDSIKIKIECTIINGQLNISLNDYINMSWNVTSKTFTTPAFTLPYKDCDWWSDNANPLLGAMLSVLYTAGSIVSDWEMGSSSISAFAPESWKPLVSMGTLYIEGEGYDGKIIAGLSGLRYKNVTSSIPDDNGFIYNKGKYTVTAEAIALNSSFKMNVDVLTPLIQGFSQCDVYIGGLPSSQSNYTVTVKVTVTNGFGQSTIAYGYPRAYGYFMPRLVLNTTGDVTSVSRCDEEGDADGLGNYGKLHLKWETANVSTTSTPSNVLTSAIVKLNGSSTALTPIGGSAADGYFDYLFELPIDREGQLSILLSDNVIDSTSLEALPITSQVVPKGVMPLSLFDDGNGVGVAYGRMATEHGFWCYLPFFLKSSDPNSNKVFEIKVDDNGVITSSESGTGTTVNSAYPIGSVYCSSTNENPTALFGGVWELFDKEFIPTHLQNIDPGCFTANADNTTSITVTAVQRNGHNLRMRVNFVVAKAVTDSTFSVATLDSTKLGFTSIFNTYFTHFNDNNDALFNMTLTTSALQINDAFSVTNQVHSVAAGTSVTLWFNVEIYYTYMIDSFCNKFYFRRIA